MTSDPSAGISKKKNRENFELRRANAHDREAQCIALKGIITWEEPPDVAAVKWRRAYAALQPEQLFDARSAVCGCA